MKKSFLYLAFLPVLLFVIGASSVKAQWVFDRQFPNSEYVSSLSAVDTNLVWILTQSSYDSGKVYKKTTNDVTELNPLHLFRPYALSGIDSSRAYLSAYNQELFYTSNSGINWIKILDSASGGNTMGWRAEFVNSIKVPNYIFLSKIYSDDSLVWVSKFFRSSNAGLNWQSQFLNLPDGSYMNDISMIDTSNIFIGVNCQGENQSIMSYIYTTNCGLNWATKEFPQVSNDHLIFAPVINPLSHIGFTFAFGYYFYRYMTTDNGATWSSPEYFSLGDNDWLIGIKYVDSTSLWICATVNRVLESPDNGANWNAMTIPLISGEGIKAIDVIRKGNFYYGFIGTSNGRLFKLIGDISAIGIRNISMVVPKSYLLYQNYPNPFNPATTVKFDLAKDGNVNLEVYDVTGAEVYSINEHKHAGSYELKFDGTGFASGVYFYRLQSGEFVDTKKMVLIK